MDFIKIIEKLDPFTAALWNISEDIRAHVTDIKLSVHKPVMLYCGDKLYYLRKDGTVTGALSKDCLLVGQKELEEIFHRLCGYAVYSHIDEIRNGYIAVDRSFRVGLSGTAVSEGGNLRTVREITGLCIRIPRQITGGAEQLLAEGVKPEQGVLIAGAPSSGKTTLLRDLARILGNSGRRTVVLDERYELLGDGFDLGICTDVLQGYPKAVGYAHAVRCLSPEFILCDELGEDDLMAVQRAAFAGVALTATVHAGTLDELRRRPLCRALLTSGIFTYVVLLKRNNHAQASVHVFRVGDIVENLADMFDRTVRPGDRLG